MVNKQQIEKLMVGHGIRPTANRILIAEALGQGDGPKTMKDLEKAILSIDKSVISRTLSLFRSRNFVHTIEDGNGALRYELCFSHGSEYDDDEHVHFFCVRCHRTFCLHDTPIPTISIPAGYIPQTESHLIRGLCPKCAQALQRNGKA